MRLSSSSSSSYVTVLSMRCRRRCRRRRRRRRRRNHRKRRLGLTLNLFSTAALPQALALLMIMMLAVALIGESVVVVIATSTTSSEDEDEYSSTTKRTTTNTNANTINKNKNKNKNNNIQLNDGRTMPRVGLGVALTGEQTYNAVTHAIQTVGYRLIDTASEESYGNEDQVGHAIHDYYFNTKENNNNNNENNNNNNNNNIHDHDHDNNDNHIFVTTKLWDSDHGFYNTIRAFVESYRELNDAFIVDDIDRTTTTDYNNNKNKNRRIPIDMYLIHSPYGGRLLETWDALLYLQQHHGDKLKSIGVSNFGIDHLELLRVAGRPMPVMNQIEMHPLVYQQRTELLEYCSLHNIQIQAFGSLMHGYSEFLIDPPPFLSNMVERYNNNNNNSNQQQQQQQQEYTIYNNNHDNNHDNKNKNNKSVEQQDDIVVDDDEDESKRENENENNPEINKTTNPKIIITTAHLLLQWALQHGFSIIPKSSRTDRITENVRYIDLEAARDDHDGNGNGNENGNGNSAPASVDFVLSDDDMDILDNWGDHVPYRYRNIYKRDWNWNPIDEAPVHDYEYEHEHEYEHEQKYEHAAGKNKKKYWPDYEGVDVDIENFDSFDDIDEDEDDYYEDDDVNDDDNDEDDNDEDKDNDKDVVDSKHGNDEL